MDRKVDLIFSLDLYLGYLIAVKIGRERERKEKIEGREDDNHKKEH